MEHRLDEYIDSLDENEFIELIKEICDLSNTHGLRLRNHNVLEKLASIHRKCVVYLMKHQELPF